MAIVGIHDDRTLISHNVVIVISIERVGELRFQARVTLSDVERVGIVSNVEQLCHFRLACIPASVSRNCFGR